MGLANWTSKFPSRIIVINAFRAESLKRIVRYITLHSSGWLCDNGGYRVINPITYKLVFSLHIWFIYIATYIYRDHASWSMEIDKYWSVNLR